MQRLNMASISVYTCLSSVFAVLVTQVHALDCYQSLLLSLVYSNNPLAEADDDEAIVRSRSPTALGTALDRLTVQRLNNEDVVTM